jgi:hypothetical protein
MRNLATFVTLLGFACGCGGNTTGSATGDGGQPSEGSSSDNELPFDGSAGDASAGVDSSSATDAWGFPPDGGPWSPVCPETAPAVGSPCAIPTMTICEYGDAWWNVVCNTTLVCNSATGTWGPASLPPLGSCVPEPGPNPPQCPANVDYIVGPCSYTELQCNYGQGVNCICTANPWVPYSPDAGLNWSCLPGPSCPSSRPRLGSGCAGTDAFCTYGAITESCHNGVWN